MRKFPKKSLSFNHQWKRTQKQSQIAANVTLTQELFFKRNFFASSTDHTTLLSNATVHCITKDEDGKYGPRQYILLPNDTPLDLAMKVDKLHLARLSADKNYIFGAKVVQRTLGSHKIVCKCLLDMALTDASSQGENPVAVASLTGLCRWVSKAIEEEESMEGDVSSQPSNIHTAISSLRANNENLYEAVKAIATGIPRPGHSVVGQGTYRDGESGLKDLAEIYLNEEMSDEAELYKDSGAKLIGIDYLSDMSRESLVDMGGSMARFTF